MQNAASAIENGEAGWQAGPVSPASTVASTFTTLYNSGTEASKEVETAPVKKDSCNQLIPSEGSTGGPAVQAPRRFWSFWTAKWQRQKEYQVPIKTRRINDHAKGYPNVAAFLDSDEGFTMCRRFGYLGSRLILDKQEELRILEERLGNLDLKIMQVDKHALCWREILGPNSKEHRKILTDIEKAYCSYANIVGATHQMMELHKPSDSEFKSVGRYIHNRQSLAGEQAEWIQHKEDLVSLRVGRDHAWLDHAIEGFIHRCRCRLIDWIFRSKETLKKTEIDGPNMPGQPSQTADQCELYYTPSRISNFANGVLTFFVLALLIVPIYILYHLVHDIGSRQAYMTCIGTLIIFTLAFSSVLSIFTKARRHEILAAAAAYCAVLVVFLSNVSPTGGST